VGIAAVNGGKLAVIENNIPLTEVGPNETSQVAAQRIGAGSQLIELFQRHFDDRQIIVYKTDVSDIPGAEFKSLDDLYFDLGPNDRTEPLWSVVTALMQKRTAEELVEPAWVNGMGLSEKIKYHVSLGNRYAHEDRIGLRPDSTLEEYRQLLAQSELLADKPEQQKIVNQRIARLFPDATILVRDISGEVHTMSVTNPYRAAGYRRKVASFGDITGVADVDKDKYKQNIDVLRALVPLSHPKCVQADIVANHVNLGYYHRTTDFPE